MPRLSPETPLLPPASSPTGQAVVTTRTAATSTSASTARPKAGQNTDRLIAEWWPAGQVCSASPAGRGARDPTVDEVILAFWRHAESTTAAPDGTPTGELANFRDSLRPLRRLYGGTPAAGFGPLAFKAVRQAMIDAGLARTTINQRIGRIVHVFKWAVAEELVPPTVHQGLKTVSRAPEGAVGRQGDRARSGRCPRRCRGRPAPRRPPGLGDDRTAEPDRDAAGRGRHDADGRPSTGAGTSGTTLPGSTRRSTTARRDRSRSAPEPGSPQAVAPGRPAGIPVQPPRSDVRVPCRAAGPADDAPLSLGPGQAEGGGRSGGFGARYSVKSYQHAIGYGCRRADVAAWHPHQLRHNAATRLRKEFGLDVARAILGHSSHAAAEIYAELDGAKAVEVMLRIG